MISSINSTTNLNASSGLQRPRAPRNNASVSFGNAATTVKTAAKKTGVFKKMGNVASAGAKKVGKFANDTKNKIAGFFNQELKVKDMAKKTGVAICTLLAGGLAAKELHDIVTHSNPEDKQ